MCTKKCRIPQEYRASSSIYLLPTSNNQNCWLCQTKMSTYWTTNMSSFFSSHMPCSAKFCPKISSVFYLVDMPNNNSNKIGKASTHNKYCSTACHSEPSTRLINRSTRPKLCRPRPIDGTKLSQTKVVQHKTIGKEDSFLRPIRAPNKFRKKYTARP